MTNRILKNMHKTCKPSTTPSSQHKACDIQKKDTVIAYGMRCTYINKQNVVEQVLSSTCNFPNILLHFSDFE